MTNTCLSQQKFCHNKYTFVMTKVFCHDKQLFVMTKVSLFCHDKITFVETNICRGKSFVTTKF